MYHVAGVVQTGDPETYFKVNLDGTKSVLAAAARAGGGLRRFLHVSSISVMGPSPDKTPLNENSPLRPVSLYGKSKLRGEQAVRASGLPWTIIRPTNILGPGQRELFTILQALRKGFKPRIGTGEKQTTICFVWDLVRAMADAAESEKTLGKTYIVSSREPYSFDSLMDIALKELGRDKVLSIPFPVLAVFARLIQVSAFMRGLPAPFDPEKLLQTRKNVWFHDPGAIERDIGFTTGISAEEGIRRTIEYYRSNNWQL
jgi:nucleoside-diphosphate-sugar epimerase